MLDRLQKPFLTVETGEAYQPIRLTYEVYEATQLISHLEQLQSIQKNPTVNSWTWYWRGETDQLHFESLDSFQKNPEHPIRLATVTLRENKLIINLSSFKRACMAVPFFHSAFNPSIATPKRADFINKVFGIEERLPHGFSDLFKDDELDHLLQQRVIDYQMVQARCEEAANAEEALKIISEYTNAEGKKRLPYAERYEFNIRSEDNPEVQFLGFYIYLRSRELVAIKRWFGESGYSLADAADETVEKVFGDLGIDIIE